jgi:purine-nucleoside phosphorylase
MSNLDQRESDSDQFRRAQQAAEFILSRTTLRPRIALVLGSGLGAFADDLENSVRIPYAEIPSFPQSTAIGHAGNLVIGTVAGVTVAAMRGRVHLYEGYSAEQVAFPVRVFACMAIRAVVFTNAAGGINPSFGRGALVVIRDHINLQGQNPLVGPNEERFGSRFPDMTDAYNCEFRAFALGEAETVGNDIHEGIYAAVLGPSYETPAEIRFLLAIGADLVGMSTVPEVIAARHSGLEVLAISCVTNMAAGLSGEKINHEEVLETGERVRGKFLALLRAVLPKIHAYLDRSAK